MCLYIVIRVGVVLPVFFPLPLPVPYSCQPIQPGCTQKIGNKPHFRPRMPPFPINRTCTLTVLLHVQVYLKEEYGCTWGWQRCVVFSWPGWNWCRSCWSAPVFWLWRPFVWRPRSQSSRHPSGNAGSPGTDPAGRTRESCFRRKNQIPMQNTVN